MGSGPTIIASVGLPAPSYGRIGSRQRGRTATKGSSRDAGMRRVDFSAPRDSRIQAVNRCPKEAVGHSRAGQFNGWRWSSGKPMPAMNGTLNVAGFAVKEKRNNSNHTLHKILLIN